MTSPLHAKGTAPACAASKEGRETGIDVFVGESEMVSLMRQMHWSATPIGAVQSWSQSLRTTLSICLDSRFPILIWWGPELVMLYNDAYRPILGTTKHPTALGQRGQECWPESWDIIGSMLTGVLTDGKATWSADQLLMLERNGYPEECANACCWRTTMRICVRISPAYYAPIMR